MYDEIAVCREYVKTSVNFGNMENIRGKMILNVLNADTKQCEGEVNDCGVVCSEVDRAYKVLSGFSVVSNDGDRERAINVQ
jgi:hypothetical protein